MSVFRRWCGRSRHRWGKRVSRWKRQRGSRCRNARRREGTVSGTWIGTFMNTIDVEDFISDLEERTDIGNGNVIDLVHELVTQYLKRNRNRQAIQESLDNIPHREMMTGGTELRNTSTPLRNIFLNTRSTLKAAEFGKKS